MPSYENLEQAKPLPREGKQIVAACGQGGAGGQSAGGAFQEAGNASCLLGERVGDTGGCIRQKSSGCTLEMDRLYCRQTVLSQVDSQRKTRVETCVATLLQGNCPCFLPPPPPREAAW